MEICQKEASPEVLLFKLLLQWCYGFFLGFGEIPQYTYEP